MTEQLHRVNSVAKMTGLGKSTIWAWVKQSKFPAPIKLSERVTAWKHSDVLAWIDEKSQ